MTQIKRLPETLKKNGINYKMILRSEKVAFGSCCFVKSGWDLRSVSLLFVLCKVGLAYELKIQKHFLEIAWSNGSEQVLFSS
jgi:hypothetical protein